MTLTDKHEILGRVSELAREIEGDDPPHVAVMIAFGELIDAVTDEVPLDADAWPPIQAALEACAATTINWLAAGPSDAS